MTTKKKTPKKKTPKKAAPMMLRVAGKSADPLLMLKKDHAKVKELFTEAEELSDRATAKARELYLEIKTELQVHAKIEEAIFYPALEAIRTKEMKKLVLEAHEEHAVVKMLLAEIDRAGPKDERFKAKLKVLKDIVLHHAEEEEDEIFPKARKNISKEQRAKLGTQMLALKAKLLSQKGKELEMSLQ